MNLKKIKNAIFDLIQMVKFYLDGLESGIYKNLVIGVFILSDIFITVTFFGIMIMVIGYAFYQFLKILGLP